ncbi:hypothetical protein, partial [uncultured Brachybacterium sp.]|uniref:hypothetical protein n=1 Tax=uncultured Brachybacterium sp. TaxID=189680 RepID=UPI0026187DF3
MSTLLLSESMSVGPPWKAGEWSETTSIQGGPPHATERPRLGNFGEHNWGISASAIMARSREDGVTIAQIAKDFGVHEMTLH